MAMDEMLGGALLGLRQGQQARQNQLGQLAGLGGSAFSGNTFTETTASTDIIRIYGDSGVSVPCESVAGKKSIRQELQAEVDEWLPKLAA